MCSEGGSNILHLLSESKRTGSVDAARALLRNGADPNELINGMAPLHITCLHDNLEMCQLLLHFGADPLQEDEQGATAIDMANGKTRAFLERLLQKDEKRRRGILRRILMCHSSTFVQTAFRKTGKKIRRFTSAPFLRRSHSQSDPRPQTKYELPPTVIVEDDPLPLENEVLPGTPIRSKTPPIDERNVTKRSGKTRASRNLARIEASSTYKPRRPRAKSLDINTTIVNVEKLKPHSSNKRPLKKETLPRNCRDHHNDYKRRSRSTPKIQNSDKIILSNYKGSKGVIYTGDSVTPKARRVAERQITRTTKHSAKGLPPPRPQPSAPPLELTPPPNSNLSSDVYLTADESLLDEIEVRLKKINLCDPEVKRVMKLTDAQLRAELKRSGLTPGPINKETRKGYERKLLLANNDVKGSLKYSLQLELAIKGKILSTSGQQLDDIVLAENLEQGIRSFIYLLIDIRMFPAANSISFANFIPSIFYVGKGTGERPFAHFIEAKKYRDSPENPSHKNLDKLRRIDSIWRCGQGIVKLEMGKEIGDKAALIREAAIMHAIGMKNLTNMKGGEWYGASRNWEGKQRSEYGVFLLQKALALYNAYPPRPVRPEEVPDTLFGGGKTK